MTTGFEGVRVLLVDDNQHMRAIVLTVLGALNIRLIKETRDGSEALETMRKWKPDLAIVDFQMFPMDGVEFTRIVRNAPDSVDLYLPIIMMTGHSERSRVTEARDAGVTEFLVKPLTSRAVIDRLNAVIYKPRPFVRTPDYFGPDRRRKALKDYPGPFRRSGDPENKGS